MGVRFFIGPGVHALSSDPSSEVRVVVTVPVSSSSAGRGVNTTCVGVSSDEKGTYRCVSTVTVVCIDRREGGNTFLCIKTNPQDGRGCTGCLLLVGVVVTFRIVTRGREEWCLTKSLPVYYIKTSQIVSPFARSPEDPFHNRLLLSGISSSGQTHREP